MPRRKLDFEQAMDRLEESLKLFEEGTALVQTCTGLLDRAEQRVSKLLAGPDGQPVEVPLDAETEEEQL